MNYENFTILLCDDEKKLIKLTRDELAYKMLCKFIMNSYKLIMVKFTPLILAIYTTGIYALPQQVAPISEDAPAASKGNVISRYLTGVGDGAAGIVSGLFSVVAHPIETAKNIGHTIAHTIKTYHSIAYNIAQDCHNDKEAFLG